MCISSNESHVYNRWVKAFTRDVACVTRTAIVCHCDHVTDEFNSKHDNKRQWQLIVSCKYKFDAGNIA